MLRNFRHRAKVVWSGASDASQSPHWSSRGHAGGHRELQAASALGRASNSHLDAKVVLERLWNVYEGAFGSVFEGILEKNEKYKDK